MLVEPELPPTVKLPGKKLPPVMCKDEVRPDEPMPLFTVFDATKVLLFKFSETSPWVWVSVLTEAELLRVTV